VVVVDGIEMSPAPDNAKLKRIADKTVKRIA
jgi:hypothetical protein